MKFRIYFILLFTIQLSIAQNKQVLFGFDEVVQNLMDNPSAKIHQKFHVSVPMLSNIYTHVGVTGFTMYDLLADDGVDVNLKLQNLLNKATNKDYYTFNQQLEVFNIGFLLNNNFKDYLSFGFYEETDLILYHPKDLITLFYEGNQDLSKSFSFNDLSFKGELLGVFHVGINRKINNKITLGLRAKIYSSVFNVSSRANSGVLSTHLGNDNIYEHQLSNLDLEMRTSGFLNKNDEPAIDSAGDVIKNFLASGNMGLGFDFGLDYKLNKQVNIKASITDLGFIRHRKNVNTYRIQGSYNFDGIDLLFPTGETIEYWKDFEDDFNEKVANVEFNDKYTSLRSMKINSSLAYSFGAKTQNNCLRSESSNAYSNQVGFQLYSIFRPKKPQYAGTIFYKKRFSKHLQTKITYTLDDYSFTNIGAGFSTQIGKFNLYMMADNLLGYTNLAKSKNQSFQFGMNLIWK